MNVGTIEQLSVAVLTASRQVSIILFMKSRTLYDNLEGRAVTLYWDMNGRIFVSRVERVCHGHKIANPIIDWYQCDDYSWTIGISATNPQWIREQIISD